MKINVIKKEIPASFNEKGGARVQIVDKTTIPLETSIKEAVKGMTVVGDELLVQAQFEGIMRSMAEGVARDGNARQLDDFLTVYAQPYGPIDLDKGWDSDVNGFSIKARLLNEMEIDITEWTFNDVTKGRKAFKVESVSTGESDEAIILGEVVHVNGGEFPEIAKTRVEWSVTDTDKSGEVASAHLSGDCSRIDIAAAALAEIKSEAYDGKEIVFTVRGNFAKATAKATLKYVADPLAPVITSATCEGAAAGECALTGKVSINGTALGTMSTSGYSLTFGVKRGDNWVVSLSPTDHYSEWTDNLIEFESGVGDLLPEGALLEDGDIAVWRVTREGHGYAEATLTYAA